MSVIPPVTRTHVEDALAEIERDGVPPRRGASGYALVANRKKYPPKYVLALAVKQATGRELASSAFSGGEQTNSILRDLGFRIEALDGRLASKAAGSKPRPRPSERARPMPAPGIPMKAPRGAQPEPKARRLPNDSKSSEPTIARLVLESRPSEDPRLQRDILIEFVTADWPQGERVKFLVTPGGFFKLPFPNAWSGTTGWHATPDDLFPLVAHAQSVLDTLVIPKLIKAARGKADVVTLGVDMHKDRSRPSPHVELVAVVDVKKGKVVAWTGKSYPVAFQAETLVHVTDLRTHLVDVAGERVLVLGCHDLNMFSPRAWANQSEGSARRERCEEMGQLVRRFDPTVVLQHPHQTDTPRIWSVGWSGLTGRAAGALLGAKSSVRAWASGIAYYNVDGPCRAELSNVLRSTKGGGGFDKTKRVRRGR